MPLTPAWSRLRYHPEQWRFWNSRARFQLAPAGRRSGKSAIAKRKLVKSAIRFGAADDGLFPYAAPTRPQAKAIAWKSLKGLVPREALAERPRESDLSMRLLNGAEICVVGMDRPQRIEGRAIDCIVCDEFADWKEAAWQEHVRPALSTPGRLGSAIVIGVPGGRNHYFAMYEQALRRKAEDGERSDWDVFWWRSADILDAAEIKAARDELDPLTFAQEYEASFVNFGGLAYYGWERTAHAAERVLYDPRIPLSFCFDFNRSPGVAVVVQDQPYRTLEPLHRPEVLRTVTACVGEVHIPQNSNTVMVCRRLAHDWGAHAGDVFLYGDATGGNKHSSSTAGSDWDQVRDVLRTTFKDRLKWRVPRENGPERARVNAMNARLRSTSGFIGVLVDPVNCRNLIEDFEGVFVVKGGTGEIDKDRDKTKTHLSDALGYKIVADHPTTSKGYVVTAL